MGLKNKVNGWMENATDGSRGMITTSQPKAPQIENLAPKRYEIISIQRINNKNNSMRRIKI